MFARVPQPRSVTALRVYMYTPGNLLHVRVVIDRVGSEPRDEPGVLSLPRSVDCSDAVMRPG